MDETVQGGSHQGVHNVHAHVESHSQGSSRGNDDVVSFKVKATTLWKSVSGILLVLLIASILTGGFDFGGTGAAVAPSPSIAPPIIDDEPQAPATFDFDGVQSVGSADAPVIIVEYSDFECPFCGRFRDQTFGALKTKYIDTGKVRLFFKHFPLESIHPMALPSAVASECAGEQGKFWEYHDLLFDNQQELSLLNMKKWAEDLKLDTAKFNNCLDNEKYLDEVKAQTQEGLANGVRGTPAFFINGQLISGAQPLSVFQQVIESALAT